MPRPKKSQHPPVREALASGNGSTPVYLIDGGAMSYKGVISVAEEYGYGGNDPHAAAKLIKAWGYRVKAI